MFAICPTPNIYHKTCNVYSNRPYLRNAGDAAYWGLRYKHGELLVLAGKCDCTFLLSVIGLVKGKGSPYTITERRVPELIAVLGSQPAGDESHKPGGRLLLLSARPAVTPATLTQFCCLVKRGTIGVNSLPKTVTRQGRDCDLNPGPSAPESSTLTTWLPIRLDQVRSGLIFRCLGVLNPCLKI